MAFNSRYYLCFHLFVGLLSLEVARLLPAAEPELGEVSRDLNPCRSEEDLRYFATRLQAVDIQLSSEHDSSGGSALRLEYFIGQPPSRVLCTYTNGSFALANWKPYQRMALEAFNPHDFPETLHFIISDAKGKSHKVAAPLAPGKWTTVTVSMDALAAAINTEHVASIIFLLHPEEMKRQSQVVHLNRLRLIGTDRQAIERAAQTERSLSKRRIPDPPVTAKVSYLPKFASTDKSPHNKIESQMPIIARSEVIVIGGGAAGVPAAVAAARSGAQVLLIEATGGLGGTATWSLPPPQYGSDGAGRLERGGIFADLDREVMELRGWALDPEARKCALDRSVEAAGVKILFRAVASDVILGPPTADGQATLKFLILETPEGRYAVEGSIFIDCTGDGDVAAAAGAPFSMGRGRDEYTQAMSRLFFQGQGTVIQHRNLMTGTVAKVDSLKVRDLTYAEVRGRQRALDASMPLGPKQYLLTSQQIGVRESRRIVGEYVLTGGDVVGGARFDDVVARCAATMDSWCAEGEWDENTYTDDVNGVWLKGSYDIPFRCLIPRNLANVLVAGRAISMTHAAQSSVRLQPTCGLLGQAAGTAAAICVRASVLPRELDIGRLQCLLVDQGVALKGVPEPDVRTKWKGQPLPAMPERDADHIREWRFDVSAPQIAWSKDVPVVCRTQVLVVGATPAGLAAAMTAAHTGVQTLVVEPNCCLGGWIADGYPFRLPPPTERGEGIFAAWCDEIGKLGVHSGEIVDPEQFKHLADRMITSCGAKLLLRTQPVDMIRDASRDRIGGLVVYTKSGYLGIAADCIIDCTNDAVVAKKAGARLIGRPPSTWRRAFLAAIPAGSNPSPPPGMAWGSGRKWLCGTVDTTSSSPLTLTQAELGARRRLASAMEDLRSRPGFEQAILLSSSYNLEPVDVPHVEGLATLGDAASTPSGIADVVFGATSAGPAPLGCLMPRGCTNLLVAGRATAMVPTAANVIDTAAVQMMLGESAGLLAATAARAGRNPSDLDPSTVVKTPEQINH
jgi:ribulose 1,5-bisphosphate synthetase/thiazole synthase